MTKHRRDSGLFRGAVSVMLSVIIPFTTMPEVALALPHGGHVTKGTATLSYATNKLLVNQSTSQASFSWTGFNVGSAQSVIYRTPGASSVSMNFIGGTGPALISGKVTSNGVLYFMDGNGLVFGSGSSVSASGVRAYGSASPEGSLTGAVRNAGMIEVSPGGSVALVGSSVTNSGTITAPSGQVILASGDTVTLSDTGSSSLSVATTGGGNVTDSGVISAENMDGTPGTIVAKAGMTSGTTTLASTTVLDASAPNGGNGGTIETSGARVNVENGASVTTLAPSGTTGTWILDPASFYIGENTGTVSNTAGNVTGYEDIRGATLGTELASSNVVIDSTQGANSSTTKGNIYVNDPVSWSSSNSLTLNAVNNIEINKGITNSGSGNIVLYADNMGIGGSATPSSGNGVVALNTGGSVATTGKVSLFTTPASFSSPAVNPGSLGGNFSNSAGSLTVYTLIDTTTELQAMNTNLSGDYALNTNIGWVSGNTTYSFTPIGESTAFSGTFNGLGHTITNLYESNSDRFLGLFGQTSSTATVENVGLVAVDISGNNSSAIVSVGGLVGWNNGKIKNSYATGKVTGQSGSEAVGGLVGFNNGRITDSYATGNVTGQALGVPGNGLGGLVGFNSGTITDSYATGKVGGLGTGTSNVGGLVGYNCGSITDSYATGSAAASSSGPDASLNGAFIGGLVGNNASGTITDSYATGSAAGTSAVGGLVGNNAGMITDSYATGGTFGTVYGGGLVGDNSGTITDSYATTGNAPNLVGSGSSTGATGLTASQFGSEGSFSGWTVANSSGFNTFTSGAFQSSASSAPWDMGTITANGSQMHAPILVADMGTATVTANNASQVYNGSAFSGGNGYTSQGAPLAGTVGYTGTSQRATNAGTYTITPEITLAAYPLQNDAGFFAYVNGTLTITAASTSTSRGTSSTPSGGSASTSGGSTFFTNYPPISALPAMEMSLPFTSSGSLMELSLPPSVAFAGSGSAAGLLSSTEPGLGGNLLEEKNLPK